MLRRPLKIYVSHLHLHISPSEDLVNLIKEGFQKMANELADLQTQVAETVDVEKAALALIQGIAARLEAAGTDPAALASLSSSLKTSADTLAAAVVANTPA